MNILVSTFNLVDTDDIFFNEWLSKLEGIILVFYKF